MVNDTPPNDVLAEQAVLGACMDNPAVISDLKLTGSDFYRPAHEQIWGAIQDLTARGIPADLQATHALLAERGLAVKVGGAPYLHDLVMSAPLTVNVAHHAEIVADRSGRRRLIEELTRALQDAYGSEDDYATISMRAEQRLGKVATADPTVGLMNLSEFLDRDLPEQQWIIPDLMTAGDRLVLTGTEGLGKSVIMRQMALCAAAGMHPFTGAFCQPRNVLLIDAENPERIMMKTMQRIREAAARHGRPIDPARFWLIRRPAGFDLGDPKERLWLHRLAQTVNAELICLGPAYKLYYGGKGESAEDLARMVTVALDSVREAVGCAVILEHHAPHAAPGSKARDVRPIGSTLWLRWPEFGLGIRLADDDNAYDRRLVDLIPWRGSRDERDWPEQLEAHGLAMPWVDATRRHYRRTA